MAKMVSSGKMGGVRYLIVPNNAKCYAEHDTEYDVTVTTPTETLETKCNCWKAARDWVERIVKQNERRKNEIDRDY